MRLHGLLWSGLVLLIGYAGAADIPYVFNERSSDAGNYDSDQLENISASSPELAGVPPISTANESDIVLFPDSKTYKTVGDLKSEFDCKVWQKKGLAFLSQARFREALEAFDQSIRLNPKCADCWNLKGVVLLATCKCIEAIKCFDVAIALDPSFAAAWNNKADALYAMSKYEEANAACDKALQIEPSSADAWYTKGRILKTEAREAFAKARMIERAA